MKNPGAPQHDRKPTKRSVRLRALFLTGSIAAVLLVAISCGTLNRTISMPPQIPGATFVGSTECATCHQDIVDFFGTASHARMVAHGDNAMNVACESCHGPGSLHAEAGGGSRTIINPGRSPQVCFACHLDVRGKFNLPYHHPVLEGKVSCTDCHEPHRGDATVGGTSLVDERSLCAKCHVAQTGPFVFEHEAMREGCGTCHDPHGSVNNKMLRERNANLCLKCHFQRQPTAGVIFIGEVNHTAFMRRGTCWSGGCHEAVHGSQVSPSLRF